MTEYLEQYKALVSRYRYKAQACRALGITVSTLTKRLNGERTVRKEHVMALQWALHEDKASIEAEAKVVGRSVEQALRAHREALPG